MNVGVKTEYNRDENERAHMNKSNRAAWYTIGEFFCLEMQNNKV